MEEITMNGFTQTSDGKLLNSFGVQVGTVDFGQVKPFLGRGLPPTAFIAGGGVIRDRSYDYNIIGFI